MILSFITKLSRSISSTIIRIQDFPKNYFVYEKREALLCTDKNYILWALSWLRVNSDRQVEGASCGGMTNIKEGALV